MKWENVYKVIETLVGNKVDLSYLEVEDKYLIEKLTDKMHMEIMTKKLHSDNMSDTIKSDNSKVNAELLVENERFKKERDIYKKALEEAKKKCRPEMLMENVILGIINNALNQGKDKTE